MNIEELEKQIKELQAQVEELKNKKENKRWRANVDGEYFNIHSDLNIHCSHDNCSYDDDRYKYHNYFKTKEEAQAVADNIKTHIELMELAEELNIESIDWANAMQLKWNVFLNCNRNEICTENAIYIKEANIVYCTNGNFKDEAIKRIGEERLIKYLKR